MPEIKKNRYNEPADIVIYVKDCGIVIREKSLIAIDKKDSTFQADRGQCFQEEVGIEREEIMEMLCKEI